DHKFDPISTQDYYSLAGVFASTQLDDQPLLPKAEADAVKAARKKLAEIDAELKALADKKDDAAAAAKIADLRKTAAAIRDATPRVDDPWAHVVREASVYVEPDGSDNTKLVYKDGPRDLPIFRRGNPTNLGPIAPRRFLTVFEPTASHRFTLGSGRSQLVDAVFGPAAGLTARVVVNRIWDQHFVAGLVRTPSDFGVQGDRPTHPEVLEHLAGELVARNWDLKWLHREILLSATYRQSSAHRPEAAGVDPGNQRLWRMNRRRLDVEMWRDAMLAAAGALDRTMGGPSKPVDDPNNVRRTLYATVDREELHGMLRMHDFPEAGSHSPRREPTTTPLQQLFLLNSPWMERRADDLWDRLKSPPTDEAKIEAAHRLLFARPATPADQDLALRFVGRPIDKTTAWKDYLQALLGVNEFHFVD
ncbi:MAG: DUF1553 domain-containing protein, partial [Planctomycetia bacterium]